MLVSVESYVRCSALSRLIFHSSSVRSANIRGWFLLVGKHQQLDAVKVLLLEGGVLVILRTVSVTMCPEIFDRFDSRIKYLCPLVVRY